MKKSLWAIALILILSLTVFAAGCNNDSEQPPQNNGGEPQEASVVDKFKGRIIGIEPGAGVMSATEEAMDVYGLDKYTLVEGSSATMAAALGDAIKNNEWIVVTGWTPHWKFARWDLKYLDDPEGIFGGEEEICTLARVGLDKDMPEVYEFMDNFNWPLAKMQEVMVWNSEENADFYQNALRFIDENEELVNSWLPEKEDPKKGKVRVIYVEWDS
ncbi:MAG: glycine betaine ABC transporter substrate-binding protein, partial [Bacillota bacterium]